ncbi:hypothetical protein D1Y84_02685 [Acidipila sp. EB88]|nr:hypothetical protein D1Y84_02685 [Acidipila sp. EB88]
MAGADRFRAKLRLPAGARAEQQPAAAPGQLLLIPGRLIWIALHGQGSRGSKGAAVLAALACVLKPATLQYRWLCRDGDMRVVQAGSTASGSTGLANAAGPNDAGNDAVNNEAPGNDTSGSVCFARHPVAHACGHSNGGKAG